MSELQKTLLFTAFGLILLLLWGVGALWLKEDPYQLLFDRLNPDDKSGILSYFSQVNEHDYRMEGDSLYVLDARAAEIRMNLAERGLPAMGTGLGWDRFDKGNFLLTDFEQRIQKIRALQDELAKTINQLDPVLSSRVHLVIPESTPFIQEIEKPRGSIYVKLRPGQTLSARQTLGIQHLVAQAVESLETHQVVVINHKGEILSRDAQQPLEALTSAQAEYQENLENKLEAKIQTILTRVVGLDQVVAKVKADIDFSQTETQIEDIDPEKTAVISSNRSKHASKGSGLNPTGVPGTKTNVPGERDDLDTAPGVLQSHDESSELLNYEVSKTLMKKTDSVGVIQKLSVAVLVDGHRKGGVYSPRTEEEMTQIQDLVKNAVGLSEARGDQLTVQNAEFATDPLEAGLFALNKKEMRAKQIQWTLTALGILFILGSAILFLRPYIRWLIHTPEQPMPSAFPTINEGRLWKNLDGTKNLMSLDEQKDFDTLDTVSKVIFISQKEPIKAAEALKQVISGQQDRG